MIKILKIFFLIILGVIVFYVVFNQFDISEVTPEFTEEEVPQGSFDLNNGYYQLWTLIEMPETDIFSDEVINRVRYMFDPQFDNDKYIKGFDLKTHKEKGMAFHKIFKGKRIRFPKDGFKQDRTSYFYSKKKQIKELEIELKVYLERYRKLIDCELFEDFTLMRYDSPIPNLLLWLNLSKLYNAINLVDAKDGNWNRAAENLLDHLNFTKRAVKGSVVLVTDLVGKAIMRYTILSIASLMNQKECPKDVFQKVLNTLQPLRYDEYGSRSSYFGEGLVINSFFDLNLHDDGKTVTKKNFFQRVLSFFFFNKNRVRKVHYDFFSKLIKYEGTLPYKWEKNLDAPSGFTSGTFWWLQNAEGKIFLEKMGYKDFIKSVARSYIAKTYYDMLRISAELHLNYRSDIPVQEILNGLRTYQTLLDPCSGKPYLWNEQKQILYSIGIDRMDNGGIFDYHDYNISDYALPVILYLK